MKFSHKGTVNFGTKANISDKIADNVSNFFKNIFSSDKEKKPVEEGKTFLNGAISGTFEYEISAELSAEDFQKICIENREDLEITIKKVPELMKSFGEGMKAIREAMAEEIPAWQDIIHEAEIKSSKDTYEEWLLDEEYRIKRDDFIKESRKKDD
jgi:Sec-independent protein translocase protein TatA